MSEQEAAVETKEIVSVVGTVIRVRPRVQHVDEAWTIRAGKVDYFSRIPEQVLDALHPEIPDASCIRVSHTNGCLRQLLGYEIELTDADVTPSNDNPESFFFVNRGRFRFVDEEAFLRNFSENQKSADDKRIELFEWQLEWQEDAFEKWKEIAKQQAKWLLAQQKWKLQQEAKKRRAKR